jgi:hypothetical protein
MLCPLGRLYPAYGVQSTLGYHTSIVTDCSNDQAGQAPFGSELPEGNTLGEGLADGVSGMNGGPFMPSDFPGFPGLEGSRFDQRHPTEGAVGTAAASTTTLDGGKKAKRTKQRLVCNYPSCKSTFPRNYELERHKRNVHDRDFSLCCSVFECRRTAKPFHREDKFKEHMRNHHDLHHFVCVIDGCVEAPLTRTELEDHLRATHDVEHCSQPHLDIALAALNLRRTWLRDGSVLLEENDKCPLAFLGCDFRDSTRGFYPHIRGHELVQRSEGYETICALCRFWSVFGLCTCPICHERLTATGSGSCIYNGELLSHLVHHTKEERAFHATVLSKMLRPYLIGKETFCSNNDAHIFHQLRTELEEVGAIQSDGSILHEGATAGNNQ